MLFHQRVAEKWECSLIRLAKISQNNKSFFPSHTWVNQKVNTASEFAEKVGVIN